MTNDLKTYIRKPASGSPPEHIVILLHGVGANGMDLLGLAQYWEKALPGALFVSPDAPFAYDMAPVGYQWFSLREWTPESILRGAQEAAPVLNGYIDKILEQYGLDEDKLALVGFSQGTMMALYAGPRRRKKIAGILGYSGALIGEEDLSGPGIQKPPVHLIHGEADSVVPVTAWHHAKDTLQQAGFTVTGHTTPGLDHGIDNDGLESGIKFLSGIF